MSAQVTIDVLSNRCPEIATKLAAHIADTMNTALLNTAAAADPITPVDTGMLRGNKSFQMASPGNLQGSITWNQEYAAYQEFGTSRMAPHPYAAPAVEQVTPSYLAALASMGL